MKLENAINHARLAKAIHAEERSVPANAALVTLLMEVEKLEAENDLLRESLQAIHDRKDDASFVFFESAAAIEGE